MTIRNVRNFFGGLTAAPVTLTFFAIAIGGLFAGSKINQTETNGHPKSNRNPASSHQITKHYYYPPIIPNRVVENSQRAETEFTDGQNDLEEVGQEGKDR